MLFHDEDPIDGDRGVVVADNCLDGSTKAMTAAALWRMIRDTGRNVDADFFMSAMVV